LQPEFQTIQKFFSELYATPEINYCVILSAICTLEFLQ
jgi:hypothetical protein